jgi:hypothetical protein
MHHSYTLVDVITYIYSHTFISKIYIYIHNNILLLVLSLNNLWTSHLINFFNTLHPTATVVTFYPFLVFLFLPYPNTNLPQGNFCIYPYVFPWSPSISLHCFSTSFCTLTRTTDLPFTFTHVHFS